MLIDGAERHLPDDIENAINTPHPHEHPEHNPPCWLIWKLEKGTRDSIPYFPELDTVCNSADSARYHVFNVLGTYNQYAANFERVWVERVPMNHRFGSSLGDIQFSIHMALWKERLKRVDGD